MPPKTNTTAQSVTNFLKGFTPGASASLKGICQSYLPYSPVLNNSVFSSDPFDGTVNLDYAAPGGENTPIENGREFAQELARLIKDLRPSGAEFNSLEFSDSPQRTDFELEIQTLLGKHVEIILTGATQADVKFTP